MERLEFFTHDDPEYIKLRRLFDEGFIDFDLNVNYLTEV